MAASAAASATATTVFAGAGASLADSVADDAVADDDCATGTVLGARWAGYVHDCEVQHGQA